LTLSDGTEKKVLNLTLPPFSVFGATTREGLLPEPLIDRFKQVVQLEPYSDADLVNVLGWLAANSLAKTITPQAATLLAVPCHGTARRAVSLVEACIETAAAEECETLEITKDIARRTLTRLRYAPTGLSSQEVKLLQVLAQSTAGRPVGLNTLAGITDSETTSIEQIYEPWLLQQGLMEKTPSGRVITDKGRTVLKASI
jgi:Holliday junction DNA helicase RuvB